MNQLLKWRLGLFLLFTVSVLATCAVRDYTNPVVQEYYQPPVITIYSPVSNGTEPGNLLVAGKADDISGIKRVEITWRDGTIQIYNPSESTSVSFYTNLYYFWSGDEHLVIRAIDKIGLVSEVSFDIYIDSVIPNVFNVSPVPGTIHFTNLTGNYLISGEAEVGTGYIDRVEVAHNENIKYLATGTTNWSCSVPMNSNSTNTYRIIAIADTGLYNDWTMLTIVQDSILPAAIIEYPLDGQKVPPSFTVRLRATDTLSPIQGMLAQLDNSSVSTNEWQDYAEVWVQNLTNGSHQVWLQSKDVAGNYSFPITNYFIVDDSIPVVAISNNFYFTNVTSFFIDGFVSIKTGETIQQIRWKVNNGTYQDVDAFTPAQQVYWTISSVSGLVANQENTLTVWALGSNGETNQSTVSFFIDTIAPVFSILDPADGTIVVNDSYFYFNMRIEDNGSGLEMFVHDVKGIGLTATNQTNYFTWETVYDDSGSVGPFAGGALVSNTLTAFDKAGNKTIRQAAVYVYPAVCVSTNGNDANHGFAAHTLRSVQAGVNKAVSLGVSYVVIGEGSYTPGNGLNTAGSGVTINDVNYLDIIGSYDFVAMTASGGITYLDGQSTLQHIISANNCNYLRLDKMAIQYASSSAVGDNHGGGIYWMNVNDSMVSNCLIQYNSMSGSDAAGGGIYVQGDRNEFYVSNVNNAANAGGGIYVSGNDNDMHGYYMYNSGYYYGGGVYIAGNNNWLNGVVAWNEATNGGGVAIFNGWNNTIYSPASIASNQSHLRGGGLLIYRGGNNNVESAVNIFLNSAVDNVSLVSYGGGVYISNSSGNNIDGAVYSNVAHYGGGMTLENSTYNILSGSICYNCAKDSGGGLAVMGGYGHTVNGNVYNNAGTNQAGGIWINKSQDISLKGHIYQNVTYGDGGGLLVQSSGNVDVTNWNIIAGNIAFGYGGGVCIAQGSDNLIQAYIYSNNVLGSFTGIGGGGVALLEATNNKVWGNIYSHSISYSNYSGGGVYVGAGSYQNLIEADIGPDNVAKWGGGVTISGARLTTVRGTIQGNQYTKYGGGVFLTNSQDSIITATILANLGSGGLSESAGGGVYDYLGNNNRIENSIIRDNTVQLYGSGVVFEQSSAARLEVSEIANNSSTSNGGAVVVLESPDVGIIDCYIISNSASSYNASIWLNSSVDVTWPGLEIRQNRFSGQNSGSPTAIREYPCDISGHIIQDNIFVTNYLNTLYLDGSGETISNSQFSILNSSSTSHDANTGGNTATVW